MHDRPGAADASRHHAIEAIRRELARLEGALLRDAGDRCPRQPAWRRVTPVESRRTAALAVVVAIGLQLALPDSLALVSRWLLPALELATLAALLVAGPSGIDPESRWLRAGSLGLIGLLSLANAWSATLLVVGIITNRFGDQAGPLLSTGAAIWLTNIIAFAIWYWELDRGGPAARAHARRLDADFLFVQMQSTDPHQLEWEPTFTDYLYLSFTNATAFSPTDVMPLTRWAKMLMLLQSLVSLTTVALVIARAVNILH
ncbi:hypothetical protein Psed_0058 [Pseudonocardia dioxanivorans CB1190]|uniref:DUF1345 domain-containing protein n=1 Tax=Pseudonocardia dioxanivorans (strain ATCC 55486 / DSM 44775 / JCM 13855 / CB1190) TaxID=675635 RepID=F4CLZ0_PSEUX|nr:DUF1345 domain-containing protein [Pseudonocardia dioxanivorans]AEA22338.1 hypothetical protein Psed_0058 [Pseudonocardia dioxanivorans CB1190]